MLESDADGVGVWSTADTTAVAQVKGRRRAAAGRGPASIALPPRLRR
jgi:hypothetical protein